MVGVTKIGRANADYWIEAVAEGGDDYYTRPGEAPGQWMGDLAADLGLEGEVDRAEYTALLAGKHPKTGKVLINRRAPHTFVDASGKTRRHDPILGYDIRFSCPKSVSLLWAIGSEEAQAAVLRAQDNAVREALGYLERHACYVQRGKNGKRLEPGEGFISMSFLHRSSRSGDMALHSHVVTANMTRALSDGRWLSLANPKRQSPLLREAKATGYVYQAALRAGLTRELGVAWEEVVNGYADLAGSDRALIDFFSKRRGEIVAEMAERGTSSAAAAEVAAYRTRDAKDYGVDPDNQRADWRAGAAEFGYTERSIDERLSLTRAHEPRPIGKEEIDGALADLEATHSHFDRRDLVCALANRMGEGADARQIEAAVRSLLQSSRVREIHHGDEPLAADYFTTPRIWAMEQRVLKSAREGVSAGVAVADESVVAAVLARHHYLSDEQAQMVRRLTTGGERVVAVAALPGSGKTTALEATREVWAGSGIYGLGIASARSASGELKDHAGIPSMSVTAFLIGCEEAAGAGRAPLPPGAVVVMDEASTTASPEFAAVLTVVESVGGKLVVIGDPRQIGAVGPGGIYGYLTNELDTIVLTEIRRQREPVDREIVELAHEGRGSDALDLFRREDRLVIGDTLDEVKDAMTLDWYQRFSAGEDAVMIARRRRDVEDLNDAAREILGAEGHLGSSQVTVAGRQFAVGDRVMTRVNNSEVSNRERWQVTGVDAGEQHLMLERIGGDGRTVILTPAYLERRTESGEPSVQHANAMTTYAMQSKTVDSAGSLLDSDISREDFTVAVSRARGETVVYGVAATELLDPDLGPATREIPDELHDLRGGAERVASEFSAAEVSERKRIEALGESELAVRREQLVKRLGVQTEGSPAREQLDALDRRIAGGHARLEKLASERDVLSGKHRDPGELARIESVEQMTVVQLQRLEAEREPLAGQVRAEMSRPAGLSGVERVELALIDDQLLNHRRQQIMSERIQPSEMIVSALGPRPEDPGDAALWNKGVEVIYAYRQRHRVSTMGDDPLGQKPRPGRDSTRLGEWQEAQTHLRRVQHGLKIDRPTSIEIDTPSIVL